MKRSLRRLLVFVALLCVAPAYLVGQDMGTLEEVIRIGAVEGERALSAIGPLALGAEGRIIAVSQPMDRRILLVDTESGNVVRILGRRGGGPGEFQQIGGVSIAGDTLFAVDRSQSRIARFSVSTGNHIGTDRYHPQVHAETGRVAWPTARAPDGMYWASPVFDMSQVASGRVRELPVLMVSPEGEILRDIARRNIAGTIGSISVGGRVIQFIQPLVKPTLFEYGPDGAMGALAEPVADRGGDVSWVRVAVFDHHGSALFDRTYPGPALPVTREVQDSLHDWLASIAGRGGHAAAARPAAVRELTVPRHLPPVQRVLVSGDGSVWFQRSQPPGARPVWTVLDQSGNEIGRVVAPPHVELRLVAGTEAWGVHTDELDVEYLVRYRIRR